MQRTVDGIKQLAGRFDAPGRSATKHLVRRHRGAEFETEMGGKYVNGVDIIRVDDSGRIVEFRVMVRPLQALNTVHELMGAELAGRPQTDAPT